MAWSPCRLYVVIAPVIPTGCSPRLVGLRSGRRALCTPGSSKDSPMDAEPSRAIWKSHIPRMKRVRNRVAPLSLLPGRERGACVHTSRTEGCDAAPSSLSVAH